MFLTEYTVFNTGVDYIPIIIFSNIILMRCCAKFRSTLNSLHYTLSAVHAKMSNQKVTNVFYQLFTLIWHIGNARIST